MRIYDGGRERGRGGPGRGGFETIVVTRIWELLRFRGALASSW